MDWLLDLTREAPEAVLSLEFYHNSLAGWLIAVAVALVSFWAMVFLKMFLQQRLEYFAKKTRTNLDDFLVELIRATRQFLFSVLAVFIGLLTLNLPQRALDIAHVITILTFLLQCAYWGNRGIVFFLDAYIQSQTDDHKRRTFQTVSGPIRFALRLLLCGILILLALDNMGVNITALIAGLGIGGIAVALAVQNVLKDLFASLTIVVDRPFEVGDFIVVGDLKGTVENIGLKTTRMRSIEGEQLVFSNSDLLESRIRNYQHMKERRVLLTFGLIYQSSAEQLEKVPVIVRESIETNKSARFERAHFFKYGANALEFEAVYFITDANHQTFMDTQQKINLSIFQRFTAEGILFAYPPYPPYPSLPGDQTINESERVS